MIKRIGLLICLLLSALCCKQKSSLTISEDKMIELLMDAHVLEATLSEVSRDVKDSIDQVMYQQFYTIHGISPEEFFKNLELIQSDPELTNKIYKRLQDTVMVRSARLEEKKKNRKERGKKNEVSIHEDFTKTYERIIKRLMQTYKLFEK